MSDKKIVIRRGHPAEVVALSPNEQEEREASRAAYNTPERVAARLEAAKQTALVELNRQAEQSRLAWITEGSGQALVYQAKYEEALRFQGSAPVTPKNDDWPFLAAELGFAGWDLSSAAAAIVAARRNWTAAAVHIEGVRRRAKKAIAQATTVAELEALLETLTWPTPPAP